jgi:hypothetical protein
MTALLTRRGICIFEVQSRLFRRSGLVTGRSSCPILIARLARLARLASIGSPTEIESESQ